LRQQETEPYRILPVFFILATMIGLFLVYNCLHIYPMLQTTLPPNMVDAEVRERGVQQGLVFNVITFLVFLSYFRCVFVHPGEVPNEPPWLYTGMFGTSSLPLQEAKKSGERRHCKWCGKYKPDRCHHCRVCKTCILKMDHHCPWIYNCVGFHNYKFFFLLLFYVVLDTNFMVYTMAETMIRAIDEDAPFVEMYLLLFGLSLAFFLAVLITMFFGFHVWLVAMGLSTIELCERKYPRSESSDRGGTCLGDCADNQSPFNLGVCRNICAVLGNNPLCWLLPLSGSPGDGLVYQVAGPRRGFEVGRGAHRTRGRAGKAPEATPQDHCGAPQGAPTKSFGLPGLSEALFVPATR